MGKKRLVTNLIANIIALVASLGISFILTPYLISTVGKEAFAFYPLSNNFVSYMMIITTALNSMASRFITIEIVKKNLDGAKSYYSSLFFANVLLVLILCIPLSIILVNLEIFISIPGHLLKEVKVLFLLVFASMLINLITIVFGVSTFAKNRLDLSSLKDIFQGILKIGLYLFIYNIFKPSIVFIGIVVFILSITNFIIQFYLSRKLLPEIKLTFSNFKIPIVIQLIKSGVWNSINSLGNVLMFGVSILLANKLVSVSASGELAIVQTLPLFLSTIITMLVAVFMPRITHVFALGETESIVKEVKFSQKILSLFTTVPVVLIIIFGKEFFSIWVPSEDSIKLQQLSVISMIPLLIHGNMWTLTGLNTVLNKVKLPSFVLIGTGLINIATCYILLKTSNLGIVIIPTISAMLSILYYLFYIPIYTSAQLNINKFTFYPTIIKSVFTFSLLIYVGKLSMEMLIINSWNGLFVWCAIYGIIGCLVHFLIIINRKDMIKIYRSIGEMVKRKKKSY